MARSKQAGGNALVHLKTHHGFERLRLRGLSGARDEFQYSGRRPDWRSRESRQWVGSGLSVAQISASGRSGHTTQSDDLAKTPPSFRRNDFFDRPSPDSRGAANSCDRGLDRRAPCACAGGLAAISCSAVPTPPFANAAGCADVEPGERERRQCQQEQVRHADER